MQLLYEYSQPYLRRRMMVLILVLILYISMVNLASAKDSLEGQNVTVSYFGLPPYIIEDGKSPDGGPSGVDPDVARILAEKMGFKITFRKEPFWVQQAANGTWLGISGSVMNGISDFGIGHNTLLLQNYFLVDYTPMMYALDVHLLCPKPKILPAYLNILLPFQVTTWVCFISAIVAVLLSNILLLIMVPNLGWRKVYLISKYMFLPWSIVLGQGVKLPAVKSRSFTFQVLLWTFSSFFLVSSFECNLRANIVAPMFETPVDSAKDLLDKGWKIYVLTGTLFIHVFKSSPDEALNVLAEQTETENLFYFPDKTGSNPFELEKFIASQGGATVTTKYMALAGFSQFEARHGSQSMRVTKEKVFPGFASFVIPKKAKWSADMSRHIQHLVDAGIVDHLIESYIPAKYLNPPKNVKLPPSAFEIEHILAAIFVLLGGITVSSFVFMLEIWNCIGNAENRKYLK